jgi:hypothetical protein
MPSPLTRNLYSMDEVVSALQISLRSGNGRAFFWLWELANSLEADTALRASLDAWLLWGGGYDPFLLTLPAPTTGPAAHILMWRVQNAIQAAGSLNAQRLLALTADLAVPPPLVIQSPIEPPLPSPPPPPPNDDDPDYGPPLWTALFQAVQTHSRRTAFWYLHAATAALCADTVWLFLTAMAAPHPLLKFALTTLRRHASPHPESQLLHQAAALLILCDPTPAVLTPAPKPPSTALACRDWDSWTAHVGRRSGRVHAIPPSALHRATSRGSLPAAYTNVGELRDPTPALLSGCRFWRTATAAAGALYDADADALRFPDDDALESFYARFFPDDIPDEWSLADQYKSHGPGCAETAPIAPVTVAVAGMGHKVDALATLLSTTHL